MLGAGAGASLFDSFAALPEALMFLFVVKYLAF